MPTGFAGIEQQLLLWMLAMVRPGAAFLAAPIFSAPQVPVQLRIILALAIGVPATAQSGLAMPADGIVSVAGFLFLLPEVLIGLALGFAVQLGYAAALLAGEAISNTMGLGFAAMANPLGGAASSAISQFLSILAIFLFFGFDGHLLLAQAIMQSYSAFPPGSFSLSQDTVGGIVELGGLVFAAGFAIALPVGAAMVILQLVMAIIARSTPSLNLFAIGLPATLAGGLVLMAMAVPVMADLVADALRQGLDHAGMIAGGDGG
jgi:flagellar biosynthesis protein FliR